MLRPNFTPKFERDMKRLAKKHVDLTPLRNIMNLILENSAASERILVQRHNKHQLKENWKGSFECHIENAGNWLLVWMETEDQAIFERTGTHKEIFGR